MERIEYKKERERKAKEWDDYFLAYQEIDLSKYRLIITRFNFLELLDYPEQLFIDNDEIEKIKKGGDVERRLRDKFNIISHKQTVFSSYGKITLEIAKRLDEGEDVFDVYLSFFKEKPIGYKGISEWDTPERDRMDIEKAFLGIPFEGGIISHFDFRNRNVVIASPYPQIGGYDVKRSEALKICENLNIGGYHDWRLPHPSEMAGLLMTNFDRGETVNNKTDLGMQFANHMMFDWVERESRRFDPYQSEAYFWTSDETVILGYHNDYCHEKNITYEDSLEKCNLVWAFRTYK